MQSAADRPVTRLEVVEAVTGMFSDGQHPDRAALVEAAMQAGARPAILHTLACLPAGPVARPGQIWNHLPEVPIDA